MNPKSEEYIMKEHSTSQDQHLPQEHTLYVAFELSNKKWKLGLSDGVKRRWKAIPARDLARLATEIGAAKAQFGLPAEVRTVSCYEAGRDGFWLHRYLQSRGIINYVIDAARIEVNRRARRAKTEIDWMLAATFAVCCSMMGERRACGAWSGCRMRALKTRVIRIARWSG
jgi:transposase